MWCIVFPHGPHYPSCNWDQKCKYAPADTYAVIFCMDVDKIFLCITGIIIVEWQYCIDLYPR